MGGARDPENVGDAKWANADYLESITDIFSRASTLVEKCRFPLYITSDVAQESFDYWKLINEQRVERNGWSSLGSSADPDTVQPPLAHFRSVSQRNHSRSRRRYLRARSSSPNLDWDAPEDEH